MEQRVDKIEHFWDALKARKRDRDREFQRRVVLGADALVHTAVKGFFRGVGIVALLWLLAQLGH
jgi:hypothetical protein